MKYGKDEIKVESLWQSKIDKDSYVVVSVVYNDNVGYFFSQLDGNNDIMTTDTLPIEEFLLSFKPQVNRYFLVCWCYSDKKIYRNGHRVFKTHDGSYLNYKDFQRIMKQVYKDFREDVVIKNIIELTDSDFNDLTK